MENKSSEKNTSFALILSDLDGTLFHNDKSISAYSKDMIARAQEKAFFLVFVLPVQK